MLLSEKKTTSKDIKMALAKYHPNDFFISECKTDSTYFAGPQGLLIFDGLAVTRSYKSPCITGYEIKISRSDFQRDNKYHLYLQYCNEFYFVVTAGLLKKEEIPDNMGLIYYYPETGKLIKKKKALYRQIEEPVGIYKYIIYSRLEPDRTPFYEGRADYAKAYIEDKAEKQAIGKALGSKMAKELAEAYCRLAVLKEKEDRLELLDSLIEVMNKNGIYCWSHERYVKKLDEALKIGAVPDDFKNLKRELTAALHIIDQMESKNDEQQYVAKGRSE